MVHCKRNLLGWQRCLRLSHALGPAIAESCTISSGVAMLLAFVVAALVPLASIAGFCPACAMLGRNDIGRSQ